MVLSVNSDIQVTIPQAVQEIQHLSPTCRRGGGPNPMSCNLSRASPSRIMCWSGKNACLSQYNLGRSGQMDCCKPSYPWHLPARSVSSMRNFRSKDLNNGSWSSLTGLMRPTHERDLCTNILSVLEASVIQLCQECTRLLPPGWNTAVQISNDNLGHQ